MAARILQSSVLTLRVMVMAALWCAASGGAAPAAPDRVPKWQRWELTLKSAVVYENPVQAAEVRVLFVSPLGETNRVYGFWDGGKTWKVRFKPGFPGRWKYFTMCSDTMNAGLHGKAGEFLCTAAEGDSPFAAHGPVAVARGQQHFEHGDRTPFFWLGDAAWQAAVKSSAAEWPEYVAQRARQKFNAVQWQLLSAADVGKTRFISGTETIALNPEAFRVMDAKIVAANRAGLVNAIAPLWEIGADAVPLLPEDQAVILFRYVLARWGADDVAWIVAFESDSSGDQARRWQNIGRAVFNPVNHAPVILAPGDSIWALDAFRNERWVDALGVQTVSVCNADSLPWLLQGSLGKERFKTPPRPLLSIAPPPEQGGGGLAGTVNGELARRLLWWNALLNTPAGVSYSAAAVAGWTRDWPAALELPGAEAIALMAEQFGRTEFWKLRSAGLSLAAAADVRPDQASVVAGTEAKDFALVFVPQAAPVVLPAALVKGRVMAKWVNVRTGETQVAPASAGGGQPFRSPGSGDWLLTLTGVREELAQVPRTKKAEPKIDKPRRD